jgi:hypothetical protein
MPSAIPHTHPCRQNAYLQFFAHDIRGERRHLSRGRRRLGAVRGLRAGERRLERVNLLRVCDARRFDDRLRTITLVARGAQLRHGGRVSGFECAQLGPKRGALRTVRGSQRLARCLVLCDCGVELGARILDLTLEGSALALVRGGRCRGFGRHFGDAMLRGDQQLVRARELCLGLGEFGCGGGLARLKRGLRLLGGGHLAGEIAMRRLQHAFRFSNALLELADVLLQCGCIGARGIGGRRIRSTLGGQR